jgi:hypothetical protein
MHTAHPGMGATVRRIPVMEDGEALVGDAGAGGYEKLTVIGELDAISDQGRSWVNLHQQEVKTARSREDVLQSGSEKRAVHAFCKTSDFNFTALIKATPEYVQTDLAALTGVAGIIAVKRTFQYLSDGTLVLPEPQTNKALKCSRALPNSPFPDLLSRATASPLHTVKA